jgi:trk system potassium uptake protein TrkH
LTRNRQSNTVAGKERSIKKERRFQPAQLLALSFVAAIFMGTFLLLLPVSTHPGENISFVDALFTSTSAVCVTGLIVQDTATYFTPAGQTVILILFQLGGLGIMAFSTLILLVAGRKVSIQDKIIIREGFHPGSAKNVKSLVKNIFFFAIAIESAGTLLLYLHWHGKFPGFKGFFYSLFHAVSAFCNAGFSVFSDSLTSFRGDVWTNATIMLLIVFGGLGFLVLSEGVENVFGAFRHRRQKMSLHSKLIWIMTLSLIVLPFVSFLLIEWNHSLLEFSLKEKLLASLFQVITPRTAGFNTMELGTLNHAAVFLLISLMFIGASPGSTGGGVKTSTIGVIFAFVRSRIAARDSVNIFFRTLPEGLVTKAFTVVVLSICVIFISCAILFLTQKGMSMKETFFEVFSAFGTVGLSLGMTAKLNAVGKIVIVVTMFFGRIGPLTLLYALSREKALGKFEYVEESVMIG